MKSTDIKLKELFLSNKMFKKGLKEFSENQTLYEALIVLKKRLKEHLQDNGINNIEALKIMNWICGIYFFIEDYESLIEMSNNIISVTPLDSEMDAIIFITYFNLFNVYVKQNADSDAVSMAKYIADNFDYRLDLSKKDNIENKFVIDALLYIYSMSSEKSKISEYDFGDIKYLKKLYESRDFLDIKAWIPMIYSSLIEVLNHFELFELIVPIVIENSVLCLVENKGIMEGLWNFKSNRLDYDDEINNNIRSLLYRESINDMFLILDYFDFYKHWFLKNDDTYNDTDFEMVINKTLKFHRLEDSFEMLSNPSFGQKIMKYQLPRPYEYASSTLLLRNDLLEEIRQIFNSEIMITMPTCKELFITKYDKSLMKDFAIIATIFKVLDNNDGHTGTRDVFVFNGSSQIDRVSFEYLGHGLGEDDSEKALLKIGKNTIIERYSMKAPCFCGSGKKFKSCCGKYFKQ